MPGGGALWPTTVLVILSVPKQSPVNCTLADGGFVCMKLSVQVPATSSVTSGVLPGMPVVVNWIALLAGTTVPLPL